MAEIFIIGGDAAGMSAASKAKREDPSLDVISEMRGIDLRTGHEATGIDTENNEVKVKSSI